MANKIEYYTSRSSNTFTLTNWESFAELTKYIGDEKETTSFADRNGNKGIYFSEYTISKNRKIVEAYLEV